MGNLLGRFVRHGRTHTTTALLAVGLAAALGGALVVAAAGGTGIYSVGSSVGVHGVGGSAASGATAPCGVAGESATGSGVYGCSTSGTGVHGFSSGGNGVWGNSMENNGVSGWSGSEFHAGVLGDTGSAVGVRGTSLYNDGVVGESDGANKSGVFGVTTDNVDGYAGYFTGRVHVNGAFSKASGSFKIDHPLAPETKYLYHSFVESPDMKNIYDGVVQLDAWGEATVELPEWFAALNRDFRYQLTPLGAAMPDLHVAAEVADNRFSIGGGCRGMKVSWQVTGIRQDPWAESHRIQVEEDKPGAEQGTYLHPAEWGQPLDKDVQWLYRPQVMKRLADRAINAGRSETSVDPGRHR